MKLEDLLGKTRPITINPREFVVKEEHIKLLGESYVGWNDYAYEGAPGLGCKRPFGNSDIERDILEITQPEKYQSMTEEEWEDWEDAEHPEFWKLYHELEFALQICVNLAGRGELIQPGWYHRPLQYSTKIWLRGRLDGSES